MQWQLILVVRVILYFYDFPTRGYWCTYFRQYGNFVLQGCEERTCTEPHFIPQIIWLFVSFNISLSQINKDYLVINVVYNKIIYIDCPYLIDMAILVFRLENTLRKAGGKSLPGDYLFFYMFSVSINLLDGKLSLVYLFIYFLFCCR